MPLYDTIGIGYAQVRKPDPRIAAHIEAAIAGCARIVNVGAGAGSYEPRDRALVAVEPSGVMIRQRPAEAAPALQATATALPFRDGAFDAALALLTIHHWPNWQRGIAELRRVARRTVLLTYDTQVGGFWLADYFPEILAIDARSMPPMDALAMALGPCEATAVPIPHDCVDGFLGAYWRRPEAYLAPEVRAGISCFPKIEAPALEAGLARLEADLRSGAWEQRYGAVYERDALDLGYRVVVSRANA